MAISQTNDDIDGILDMSERIEYPKVIQSQKISAMKFPIDEIPQTEDNKISRNGGSSNDDVNFSMDSKNEDGVVGFAIDEIPFQASPLKSTPGSEHVADDSKSSFSRQSRFSIINRNWSKREREVLVGTPVKEGHVNYYLMYDMLTGIRISVSRYNSKPNREELDLGDFKAAHKLAFDITGNELTPKSPYDFKFKDYAPWVFRKVREIFHVDPNEYLLSLTGKYVLSELGSPGKSGSFFYFSQDYRYIIKTIHRSEHDFLLTVLKDYYDHIKTNPHTLLSRIFGLHRVKQPGKNKIHFVVMGNVFPANKDIHEVYDLKGSLAGRSIPEEEAKSNPRAVLKDLNWLNRGRKLNFGPEKRQLLIQQMKRDVDFLQKHGIMDYSLLIGIHDLRKGNADHIRDTTLSIFEPSVAALNRRSTPANQISSRSIKVKKEKAKPEVVQLGPSAGKLPQNVPQERMHCIFYQDQGGFWGSNEDNTPTHDLYYIGIIDILTKYNATKRIETFFRSFANDRKKISAVDPKLYGNRFLAFMKAAISGYTEKDDESNPILETRLSNTVIPVCEKGVKQNGKATLVQASQFFPSEMAIENIQKTARNRGKSLESLKVLTGLPDSNTEKSLDIVSSSLPNPASPIQFQLERSLTELRRSFDIQKKFTEQETQKLKQGRTKRKSQDVLFGTPIKEGHPNYMLMYDMLTGIRISVSRSENKPLSELTLADFKAAHKLAFDSTGAELTPKSKYDFKFKDYAPAIFRRIRDIFHVESGEYLLSLTGKYILSEFASSGKSGSFFYYSRDYRFIIKTIRANEKQFLLSMLKDYYEHIKSNPHTLLCRIFGLHRVKQPGNKKIHFVVMGNVFPPNKDIHEVYDLKGSLLGRHIPPEEVENNPLAVMKDLNWLEREKSICLGPEKRELFFLQLERDVAFLKEHEIMDYSLLIGIHDVHKGNIEDLRNTTLSLYEPDRQKVYSTDVERLKLPSRVTKKHKPQLDVDVNHNIPSLTESIPKERLYCIFYQDQGGFRATDEHNIQGDEIYYLGIIDIFTKYSTMKKLETFWKSIGQSASQISSIPPKQYGKRFLQFIMNTVQEVGSSRIHKSRPLKLQASELHRPPRSAPINIPSRSL